MQESLSAFTASSLTGCTATAYDLNGSTALGSGSVSSDGTFTIESSSLTAGTSYKIVTSCSGGTKLSAVIAADSVAPASKTPSSVDPLTTLVTTQIVSAIITAVNTATSGLPNAAKEAIKSALLKPEVLNNIITTVTTAVKSAVEYGSMEAPSLQAASSMSEAVATATDTNAAAITTAEDAYKNDGGVGARQIPPTITDTVAGAAKSAAALPACDSSLASQVDGNGLPLASVALCTQAVAKLIFNDVHFGIALRKSGGAFGTISNCSSANSSLADAFKNAKFTDGDTDSPDQIPSGVCVIESALPTLDRNRGYDQQGEGDHGGMVFFESFSGNEGLITNLATALYNGYNYTLSDLDSLVFTYDATKGGMNARLIYQESSYTWSGSSGSMNRAYYLLQTSGGVNSLASFTWPSCGGGLGYPCYPGPGNGGAFATGLNPDWSLASGTTNADLALAIRNSAWSGSVFLKKFGGPIPDASKLISSFADDTTHSDHNRSGQSKFYVLYAKQPDWNNPNCQWGTASGTSYTLPSGATTTKCTANDGTEEPAVRVNVTFSAPDSTTKLTQIASITKSTTGRYYLYPQFNGKFTGLFQLVDSITGRIIMDERFNQRAVAVIMDASSECGNSTTHTPSSGCAAGKMYNAKISWNCSSSNSPCSVSYTVGNSTAEQTAINTTVPSGQTAYNLDVVYQTNMLWSMTGPGAVGAGRSDGQNYSSSGGSPAFKAIFVAADATTGVVSAPELAASSGSLPSTFPSNKFAIQQRQSCTQSGSNWTCTPLGYWLVDSAGVPFRASGTVDAALPTQPTAYTTGQADWNKDYCPQGGGSCFTPTVYDDSYFQSLGGSFFTYANGGSGGWQAVAQQPMIFSGPAANPNYNCSLDPFFIDGSGTGTADGKINATTDPTTGQVICLETTFNGTWDAAQYKVNHPSATIAMNHDNAFVYGDPASVTALLQKAFGPMLDGKHTLAADTRLNALQAFGLLYVLMSTHSDEGTYIDGILPDANNRPRNTFTIATPVCDGDGAVINCNAAIGKGFIGYHR